MVIAHYCVEHISVQGEIYMDKTMMWIMAICALIGGTDRLLGNRLGLGKRFEDGFQLLGPTALSMAGLICITPLVSLGLEYTIVPFYRMLHLDPGMLGGILALDMGGYQLCKELALDPAIGRYGGIIVGATYAWLYDYFYDSGRDGNVRRAGEAIVCKRNISRFECAACRNFGGRTVVRSFYWEIAHSEYSGISSGGTVDTGTFPIPG